MSKKEKNATENTKEYSTGERAAAVHVRGIDLEQNCDTHEMTGGIDCPDYSGIDLHKQHCKAQLQIERLRHTMQRHRRGGNLQM